MRYITYCQIFTCSFSSQRIQPLLYRCAVHHQMLHNVLEALKKTKKFQSNRGKQTLVIESMSCVLPSSISPYTTVNMSPSVSGCSSRVRERMQVIKSSLFLNLTVEDGQRCRLMNALSQCIS